MVSFAAVFFFSSRRRHTRCSRDWSSDVCSSDLGSDPRIAAVVAEASFANLREAAYDYAGLRKYPWLGKTLLSPFAWTLLYRGARLTGIPLEEVSPVKAVAARAFPVRSEEHTSEL